MSGVDIEEIRTDLFKRFEAAIPANDPILIAALFNERVLLNLATQISLILEEVHNQASAGTVQQLDTAKKMAEQLVTQAAIYIKQQTGEAIDQASDRLVQRMDMHVRELDLRMQAAEVARKGASKAQFVAIGGGAASFVFFLLGLVTYLIH